MENSTSFNQDVLSVRACPLCGDDASTPSFKVFAKTFYYDLYGVTEGNVVKCRNCGLHFTNPTLNERCDSDQYVNRKIGYEGPASSILYWEDQLLCFYELMEQVKTPQDAILDFGCGKGGFVFLCQGKDLNIKGIDVSSSSIETGLHHGVKNIFCSDLYCEPDKHYDCIVALHVLEHCRDVQPIAREFKRILKPNGKVLLMVPNYGSVRFRLNPKRYWRDVYMHLNGITVHHLDAVFGKYDFRRAALKCSYGVDKTAEIPIKTVISMKLTKYLGNWLNIFPTKLFCVYQLT